MSDHVILLLALLAGLASLALIPSRRDRLAVAVILVGLLLVALLVRGPWL